jgi:hypothetical protein
MAVLATAKCGRHRLDVCEEFLAEKTNRRWCWCVRGSNGVNGSCGRVEKVVTILVVVVVRRCWNARRRSRLAIVLCGAFALGYDHSR